MITKTYLKIRNTNNLTHLPINDMVYMNSSLAWLSIIVFYIYKHGYGGYIVKAQTIIKINFFVSDIYWIN